MATKAELQSAIDEANADRLPEDQIVPEGSNKGDLEKALSEAGIDLPEGEPTASKGGDLKVNAPIVAVSTKGGDVRQMYFGDVLGDDVTKESVDHLRSLGFVSDEN